jgi:N-acetylglucosaminyl-diphospho-decaprenol L-rhamnosyltransferase
MSSSTLDSTSAPAVPALRGTVDCAVAIVTYNSTDHISALLDSLPAAAGNLRIRCVVIDNGSRDGTIELLRTRRDVTLIETGRNLGYAGGINVARAHCGSCSSILILNPDLELEPDAIVHLYEALDDPSVGVAVPMLLNEDGSRFFTLRREPSPTRALGDALFGERCRDRPGWLTETIYAPDAYRRPTDVAWAGGAALLISSECNSTVGDWDSERFFLYSEETDFFARARRYGYRVRSVPGANARHVGGGSGTAPELAALLAVNRVRYYEKYHGRTVSALFRAAVMIHYLLRSSSRAERQALTTLCRRSRWSRLPRVQA